MLCTIPHRLAARSLAARQFSKMADIPTKYNVLTIPVLRDNFCAF